MDNNYLQNQNEHQEINNQQQVIQVNQQQNIEQQQNENRQLETNIFAKHFDTSNQYMNDRKRSGEEDSREMQVVKSCLSEVTQVLNQQMNEDETQFRLQITSLKDHFNELIASCDAYLAAKKWAKYALFGEAKRRRKMVISIKEMAQTEANCLSGLSKDKDLHKMRVQGLLVGNALSSALRDYQAIKNDVRMSSLNLEGGLYTGSFVNSDTDIRDDIIVNKTAGQLNDKMKSAVCADRLAKFIGMDGICSRSKLVIAKDEQNKFHYGIRSEGQPEYHKTLAEIKEEKGRTPYKLSYSGEALKQISNARLFHMILGGTSLKAESDLVMIYSETQMGEEITYHITGAYLNTGAANFSDKADTKAMDNLLQKGDFLMTDTMAETILNLEPGDMDYVAGEMLSKESKAAFAKRVNHLKEWIRNKKAEEEQSGPSRILSEEVWKDKESLEEVRDRINATKNGFHLSILKNNAYIEETDGDKQGDYEKEYQKLYKKLKTNLENANDVKTRIYILGALNEIRPVYEKKLPANSVGKNMVDDIQTRLMSEFVNDELIKEYYNELWRVKGELAKIYDRENKQKNKNAAFNTVNKNRELYRSYKLLENMSTSWMTGAALGRNLKFNRLELYVRDYGQEHMKNLAKESAEEEIAAQKGDIKTVNNKIQEHLDKLKLKISGDSDKVEKIDAEFKKFKNGDEKKNFDGQMEQWGEKEFLKNPTVALRSTFSKSNVKTSIFGEDFDEQKVPEAAKKEYKELMKAYEALEEFKEFKLPQRPVFPDKVDNIMEIAKHREKEKAYEEQIVNTGLLFSQFYVRLRTALYNYGTKAKDQRAVDYLSKLGNEEMLFTNMISEFVANNKTYDKDTTWKEVINGQFKIKYDITNKENLGGGTSEVYKLEDANGTVKYFKPIDTIYKNQTETFNAVTKVEKDRIANDKNIDKNSKAIMVSFINYMEKTLANDYKKIKPDLLYNIYMSAWDYVPTKDYHKNTEKFYEKLIFGNEGNDQQFEEIFSKIISLDDKNIPGIISKVIMELHQNTKNVPENILNELKKITVKIMTDFTFKLNQYELCTGSAKIKPKNNNTSMATRNTATSRLAGLLGIRNLVAHSELTIVKKGNKFVMGNVMEEAKGKKIRRVSSFNRYSSQGIMDINTMLIFDMIYGQIDRHEENFHYITHKQIIDGKEKEVIDSVHMIDNDMGGGNLTVEDIKKGVNVAEGYNPDVLRAIPNKVRRKIKSLDIKTVSLILGDIHSAEEIEYLGKRLKFIQDEIDKLDKEVEDLSKSDKAEERFKAFLLQDEEYRVLLFEKSKILKSKVRNKGPVNKATFKSITVTALPSLDEVEKEIQDLTEVKKIEFEQMDKK